MTKALRLAKSLEQLGADIYFTHRTEDLEAAAVELRRMHIVNADLLEALQIISDVLQIIPTGPRTKIDEAILKVIGETE